MKKVLLLFLTFVFVLPLSMYGQRSRAYIECENNVKCYLPMPEPIMLPDSVVACKGNNFAYRVVCEDMDTCYWSVQGGDDFVVSSGGRKISVTWGDEEEGLLNVMVLTYNGDTLYDDMTVKLVDKPKAKCLSAPNFYIDQTSGEKHILICAAMPIVFQDASELGESALASCIWSCEGETSTSSSFTFLPGSVGTYKMLHMVTNECGCYDEEAIFIEVKEECPIEMSCYGTVCANTTANYTISSPVCEEYNWIVEGGTIIEAAGSSISVHWDNPSSGYGTMTLDGSSCKCSCPNNKTIRVPIISDNVEIKGPDTVCANEEQVFSVPLWAATVYQWDLVEGNANAYFRYGSQNATSAIFNNPGVYHIRLTYACSFLDCGPFTAEKTIVVQDSLRILSSTGTTLCKGAIGAFGCNASAGEILSWQVRFMGRVVATGSSQSLNYVFDTSGIYYVEAQGNKHCNTARFRVEVRPQPPKPLLHRRTSCPNGSILLTADSIKSYCYLSWFATEPSTQPQVATGDSVSFQFNGAVGNFIVYQIDMDYGCMSQPATQYVSTPQFAATSLPDTINFCQGQTKVLTVPDQRDDGFLYVWRADSTHHVTVKKGEMEPTVTLMANYNTLHQIPYCRKLYLYRKMCDLERTDTFVVRVGTPDIPSIYITPSNNVCEGTYAKFEIGQEFMNIAVDTACRWYESNGRTHRGLSFSQAMDSSETITFHFQPKGCSAVNTSSHITVHPLPTATITTDFSNNTVSIVTADSNSVLWNTGETERTISYGANAEYCCNVTSPSGCTKKFCTQSEGHPCIQVRKKVIAEVEQGCFNEIKVIFNQAMNDAQMYFLQGVYSVIYNIGDAEYVKTKVPYVGRYVIRVEWGVDDTCYFDTCSYINLCIPYLSVFSDCDGNVIVEDTSKYYGTVTGDRTIVFENTTTGQVEATGQLAAGAMRLLMPRVLFTVNALYNVTLRKDGCEELFYYRHQDTLHLDTVVIMQNVCFNTPFLFWAKARGADLSYRWDFDDFTYNYGDSLCHAFSYRLVANEPSCSYQPHVTLTVTDARGCSISKDTTIDVNNEAVDIKATSDSQTVCPGNPKQVFLRDNAGPIGYFYWYEGDTLLLPENYIASCSVYQTGNYKFLGVTSRYGCHAEALANAGFLASPTARIKCKDTYCMGEVVSLNGACGNRVTYHWTVSDSAGHVVQASTAATATLPVLQSGRYKAQLIVTNPETGCSDTATRGFVVMPPVNDPVLAYGSNACIDQGPVELVSQNGESLHWSNGTVGDKTFYYRGGLASAYYEDSFSHCRSRDISLLIPLPPNMDGFLSGCYHFCESAAIYVPFLGSYSTSNVNLYRNGALYDDNMALPTTLVLTQTGSYSLGATYGSNCGPIVSHELELEREQDCKTRCLQVSIALTDPTVDGCDIVFKGIATIKNGCDTSITVDRIALYPYMPCAVDYPLPVVLDSGEVVQVPITIDYNAMPVLGADVFVFSGSIAMGVTSADFSNWQDCIQDCGYGFEYIDHRLEPNVGTPYQASYLRFRLDLPNDVSSCSALWSDNGSIVSSTWLSAQTVEGLLLLDYGTLTQLAAKDSCVSIKAFVCIKEEEPCIIDTCIPAKMVLEEVNRANGKARETMPQNRQADNEQGNELMLSPNPSSGMVTVRDITSEPAKGISNIKVISMVGKTLIVATQTNRFDVSALPEGAYIVVIRKNDGKVAYLKFVKQGHVDKR